MKIIYTSIDGESKDITEIVGEMTISGSVDQVSRMLDFELLRPDIDYYMPKVHIKLGSTITIFDDEDEEVYAGIAWFKNFDDNEIKQRITCYDIGLYTSKSEPETQVFTDMTCKEIAESVLSELGLPIGDLDEGVVLSLNARNKTAYEVIMAAYTKAAKKNGKKYHMVCDAGKISVVEMDEEVETVVEHREQDLPGSILGISYEESIDNMVNKVKTINDKNKDEKSDAGETSEDIENFGLVQRIIYGQEEDVQGILQGARTNISLECFGDWSMRSGYSITINAKHVEGKYYIKSDTHTINDVTHIVRMELTDESEMKEVELDEK